LTEVSFGEWLKRQRNSRGLTQEQLAHQIGCATITLRKIESEERRPSAAIVEQLGKIFEIPQKEQPNFLKFARGDWTKSPSTSSDEKPWQFSKSPRTNLPEPLTSFIGREKELVDVINLITKHRLVTLIGPGGVGKTRLSLKIGEQLIENYDDGVWLVEFASILDPLLVPHTTAIAIGLRDEPQRPVIDMLSDYLHGKSMLIILDNCEHLLDACAQLATTLLKRCPKLRILATSREALGILGEANYPVPSLELPDLQQLIEKIKHYESVRLFEERAQLIQIDFMLTIENVFSVVNVCNQLDGIPLAIELAAARVGMFSTEKISESLHHSFNLLSAGNRTALPRHQTLRAAIDWSYDLLSPVEQTLFRRLSVFVNGWTLEAAEAICSDVKVDPEMIIDVLTQITNKSLVITDDSQAKTRYRMLETIRQYANEKLVESKEIKQIQNSHLNFFMKLAEEAEPKLNGGEQALWLERFEIEQGNFSTALRWGLENRAEAGFRLVSALWLFWFMHAHFIEGRQWYDEALSVCKDISPMLRIRLLTAAASNAMGRNDFKETAILSEQGLSLAREQKNEWGIAMSLHHLGIAATEKGDYKRAQSLLEEGLVLSRRMKYWEIAAYTLSDLGALASAQGYEEQAVRFYEEALALDREQENRWGSSYDLQLLAYTAYQQRDHRKAKELIRQSLTLAQEFNDKQVVSSLIELMGTIALYQSQLERAAKLIGVAEALIESIGIPFKPDGQNLVVTVRERLGDAGFESLVAEGRAMTMAQAIEYALKE